MYETLLYERGNDGVALCTINRPESRNALNQAMVDELHDVASTARTDTALTALIFTGAGGKAFLGGADIGELKERDRIDAMRRINTGLFRAIEAITAPTIAAITGYALGGGCELAMACDLRIAGEGAKLGQPEVGLGIIPGAGATYRLPRLVGVGKARELIFTGRIIDAVEAERIGLVNRVVPDAEVVGAARELAAEIGRASPAAVRYAKLALSVTGEMSTDAAMAFEATAQAVLFEDQEKHRRMQAFLDRRKGK